MQAVNALSLFVDSLEGDALPGTSQQVSPLGIEGDADGRFGVLVQPAFGPSQKIACAIVSRFLRCLIDGEYTRVDCAVLAEEVGGHLTVVELLTVLPVIGMCGHAEVEHPLRIGTKLIESGVEGVFQDEVTASVSLVGDDELLALDDESVW